MKKHLVINWERVWIYILLIIIVVLIHSNYKLETTRIWSDDVNAYATKISIKEK